MTEMLLTVTLNINSFQSKKQVLLHVKITNELFCMHYCYSYNERHFKQMSDVNI